MLYREYGQTGVEVSALGMGCMRFERPDDIEDMAQVVYHAFEKGVTYSIPRLSIVTTKVKRLWALPSRK